MNPKKTFKIPENTLPNVAKPIARVVSLRLAILITIVTSAASIASYFYYMDSTEKLVREQLIKYIGERGLRESALFLESNDYQARFQKEYVERYKRTSDKEVTEWFKEHMEKHREDGTYRSKPELYYGKDMPLGRRDVWATMMIGANTKITPDILKALAVGYDMVNQYGPAWRKPFDDLYFSSPDKTSVSRWPGTPWGLIMDDKVDWTSEEWVTITTVEKNPQREQKWSGILFDERNGNWMVSNVTPLDIEGKQVGLVGTDLLLDDLVDRTINETMPGTYNILLQADGRVIAHPYKIREIISTKGTLSAKTSTDKHLQNIYKQIQRVNTFPAVLDYNDKDAKEFIGVTQIKGPGWYFVTVYPKSLLADKGLRNAGFVLLSGLASLVIMILLIRLILKKNLVDPLEGLTQTVENFKMPKGRWSKRADKFVENATTLSTQPDEIGLLASSFVHMGNHLRTTYNALEANKKNLETKVKDRTKDLENAKNTAEAANRAKSLFLANMSHELRTPLNAILGYAQLLERDLTINTDQGEEVRIISQSGKNLLSLINDVLEIAKIEAHKTTLYNNSFDFYDFLRSISELFHSRTVEKGLFFTLEKDNNLPQYIKCDENKLRQVLINLLGNALKFTETGSITLRVKSEDPTKNIHTLYFEVEDTGIGIAPDDLEKIFEPFSQSSDNIDKTEGTGLGLTITREFINLMGGTIKVESELDKGSLFRFEIIVNNAKDSEIIKTSQSRRVLCLTPDQPSFRILVVEDILESRNLLVKLLKKVGFEVQEAPNGKVGIEIFKAWKPHLIWMDMRMPVMDGYEATRLIKKTKAGQKTVIIALTAHAFEEERQQILKVGCDDFIKKPYLEEELFAAMEKHLRTKFIYEEPEIFISEETQNKLKTITPESLAGIPEEIKKNLLKATTKLDQKYCFKLLDQLSITNKEAAHTLRVLVDNYRFEELENLLEDK